MFTPPRDIRATARNWSERALGLLAPFLGLAAVMGVFYALAPDQPLRLVHLQFISVHTVIVGIAALGMTFVIISGGIDLSVGSAIALASVSAALVLRSAEHWAEPWQNGALPLAALAAVGTGGLCGLYNGLLITGLRLPPFIATLGTLGFYRGVAKWVSGSIPVSAPDRGLAWVIDPIPEPAWLTFAPGVWLMLIVALVLAGVLHLTVLGRYAYAVGSNEAAARLCGIRVGRVKVQIYVLAGLLVGLAGLMQFARLTLGDPTVAVGLELDIIAAVVIGGGSLAGGQGSLTGTLAGALLMAYLRNRCAVLGYPDYVQEMIVGHIIIIAVALDQWRIRRRQA